MGQVRLMESDTERFAVELSESDRQAIQPRSFMLYEEFSRKKIRDAVSRCREVFMNACPERKRDLETEADTEVECFRIWLETKKHLSAFTAHYCSLSLKSVLIGLPSGFQIACLFDLALAKTIDP